MNNSIFNKIDLDKATAIYLGRLPAEFAYTDSHFKDCWDLRAKLCCRSPGSCFGYPYAEKRVGPKSCRTHSEGAFATKLILIVMPARGLFARSRCRKLGACLRFAGFNYFLNFHSGVIDVVGTYLHLNACSVKEPFVSLQVVSLTRYSGISRDNSKQSMLCAEGARGIKAKP